MNNTIIPGYLFNEGEYEQTTCNKQYISTVINTLFDIHTGLKNKKYIESRTAETALLNAKLSKYKENGIDVDKHMKMYNKVQELFNCSICQDILNDPIGNNCCNNLFCKKCITKWININPSCPLCKKEITSDNLKENNYINNLVNEINKVL